MLDKIMKTALVMLLVGLLIPTQATADTRINSGSLSLINDIGLVLDQLSEPLTFSTKRGVPYDESKDPALRKGSENSEQPQYDFFIIPIVLFVGMGLFLYYNKL